MRPPLTLFSLLILLSGGAARAAAPVTWQTAGEIVSRIKPPAFPAHDFAITSYGAQAGGEVDATGALRQAIAACSLAGGGRVVVPAGIFLTGGIELKSNVNLYLAPGATLQFSTDPNAYLPLVYTRWEGVECMNYAPLIYALDQENVAVTGSGTLDGGAGDENWWQWARKGPDKRSMASPDSEALGKLSSQKVAVAERRFGPGHHLRPNFFQPYRCKNVLIEGVTIKRSPMWEVNPVLCSNVTVRDLKIDSHGPNNDGCDPESCRDVLIERCVFDTGDDCIAIKSGRNDDGRRVGVASENLVIRGCTMKDGHGGVVFGSEIAGGCRNVFIEDCTMDSPNLERALRFKSNAQRGGTVENIFMRQVRIGQVAEAIITVDFLYEEGANGPQQPVVRNVQLEHVTSRASPRIFYIAGFQGAIIDQIRLSHCTFAGVDSSELIEHAGRIELEDVTILPAKRVKSLSSREPGTL